MFYTGPKDHTHLVPIWCSDGRDCTFRDTPDMYVPMGPLTGLDGVAAELMRHLGYEPAEHRDLFREIADAVADETLDLGRQILAEHGMPVRDSVTGGPLPCLAQPAST